ncbi:MAG: hypothetical protein NPIRA04_00800 [Nitrospirales bacterium]|nr:MAG: hypothetical protein NPIRA04_00800 [Nitrospirales bacterium]
MDGIDVGTALQDVGDVFDAVPGRIQEENLCFGVNAFYEYLIILDAGIDEHQLPSI